LKLVTDKNTHMSVIETTNWLDYRIVVKQDEGTKSKMIVVLKNGAHVHVEFYYKTDEQMDSVKRMMIFRYMLARPKEFATLISTALMDGLPSSIFHALKEALFVDGIELPDEITGSYNVLRYKDQPLFINGQMLHR